MSQIELLKLIAVAKDDTLKLYDLFAQTNSLVTTLIRLVMKTSPLPLEERRATEARTETMDEHLEALRAGVVQQRQVIQDGLAELEATQTQEN